MKQSLLGFLKLKKIPIIVSVVFVVGLFGFVSFFYEKKSDVQNISAGNSDNVSGFAFSENIGWISFNSDDAANTEDYGVNVETAIPSRLGNFSGYAWSQNVGWISFNEDASLLTDNPGGGNPYASILAAGGCGGCTAANDCTACYGSDGKIYGWAKILSMGADGWIRFDDDSPAAPNYGVSVDLGIAKGWAWNGNGDSGIGWISFNSRDCDVNGNGVFEGAIELAPNGCPTSGAVNAYAVILDVNNPPIASNLLATTTPCVGSARTVTFSWDYNDSDPQSKFRISVPSQGINHTEVSSAHQYTTSVLPLGFSGEWTLTVWDSFNTESSLATSTVIIYPNEFPTASFTWHAPSPSANETVSFVGNSQYFPSGIQTSCDDAHCAYEWTTSDSDDVISSPTSSSTLIIFGNYNANTIIFKVRDKLTDVTCGTSTNQKIKNRLPNWIESGN